MGYIVLLLFPYKDRFSIKWPTKVDMSLNTETKQNLLYAFF